MNYLLAILAAYRLARMLATEEGPGGIFEAVRGRCDPEQATWLGRGLNCPLCISYWIAALCALALSYLAGSFDAVRFVLEWNAIAGGVVVVHILVEK